MNEEAGPSTEAVPSLKPIGITIPHAMALLSISRKALERLIDRGDILIFYIGTSEATGGIRVDFKSLESFAETHRVDPAKRHTRR